MEIIVTVNRNLYFNSYSLYIITKATNKACCVRYGIFTSNYNF